MKKARLPGHAERWSFIVSGRTDLKGRYVWDPYMLLNSSTTFHQRPRLVHIESKSGRVGCAWLTIVCLWATKLPNF